MEATPAETAPDTTPAEEAPAEPATEEAETPDEETTESDEEVATPVPTEPDEETEATTSEDETSPEVEASFHTIYTDPDLTPEKLNAKLNEYATAYQQEFELKSQEAPENVEEYTRDFFKRNVHSSAAQIVWLATNADSETVRLNASKTVLQMAFEDSRADGDPIKKLMRELTSKPSTIKPYAANSN